MKYDNFNEQVTIIQNQIKQLETKSFKISMLRLVFGVAIIIFILISYFRQVMIFFYLSLLLLIGFIILVVYYNRLMKLLNYHQARLVVLQRYLARFNQDWNQFAETGKDLFLVNDGIVKDLDLAGNNSLFQYLNTALTTFGKKRLAAKLTRRDLNYQLLLDEQAAVKELSDKLDFVLEVETVANTVLEYQRSERAINDFIRLTTDYQNKNHQVWLGYLFPIIAIIALLSFCFNLETRFSLLIFGVLFLGQLIGSLVNLMRHQAIFDCVSKLSSSLSYYLQVCHLVVETDFKANHLLKIKKMLSEAYQQLKQLEIISNMIKQRSNLLAFLLLNGLLSWDYHCCCRLDNWLQTNVNMSKWLNQIGELESLISLQTLYQVKDDVTMPTLLDESKPILSFRELKHPLLLEKTAVANSFTMESQVAIITGSNMSGKTTFLRTVGINLVLSYAGGPVIAKDFSCSLMEIFTSMRIEDDIQGISTFYGELLRIKEMVKANQSQRIMIALIDEIFKGTNSADRIIGALETVKRLSSSNIFTLITTHDFELCDLENEVSCKNYHFEEYYQDNQIKFDYLIKPGRSQTTNAQFLLKMVGIIE